MKRNRLSRRRKQLTEKEKERYVKIFLGRFLNGELNEKEKEIVTGLKANAIQHPLTDDELQKKLISGFDRLAETIGVEKLTPMEARRLLKDKKQNRRVLRPWMAYGTVAAIAALLLIIGFNSPSIRRTVLSANLVAEALVRDSFATGQEIKSIRLSDGTAIHLNTNTKLSLYKDKYAGKTREVWLDEGEAFFDVARDADHPFIVHTADGVSTRVLGTSFNIKAYGELNEQIISVRTGKVRISDADGKYIQITSDRKVIFNKADHSLTQSLTDTELAASWRSGQLVFDDAGLDEIAMKILRRYGKQVIVTNEALPETIRLKAVFPPDTEVELIARQIADMYGIGYRLENSRLIFEQMDERLKVN